MDAAELLELLVDFFNGEKEPPRLAVRCWESRKCKSSSCRYHGQLAGICWEQDKPECENCSYRRSLSESDILLLHIERLCASYEDFKRRASIYRQILDRSQGVFKLGREVKKIAHELNNIVGSMKGYIQLAIMVGSEQSLNQAFNISLQACKRIEDLVEHIRRLYGNTNLSLERPADHYAEIFDSMLSE
ncbi:MAG TPA: hypothetical protein ENF73_01500, partial [Proteobacteria bacterium]|nr:hypothetical protein [Pseudomonadota bacterium]